MRGDLLDGDARRLAHFGVRIVRRPLQRVERARPVGGEHGLVAERLHGLATRQTSPDVARRIYAFVVLGGVLGGVFGSTVVKACISVLPTSVWLWTAAAATLAIMLIAFTVARLGIPKREATRRWGPRGGGQGHGR